MKQHKLLLGLGATAAIILISFAWLSAKQSTTGAVTANPAYVVVSTPTTVRFTAIITDPTVQPGVNLLKVDSTGRTLVNLGAMSDSGTNGDVVAGDRVFSRLVSVSEPSIGHVYYRVSVPFKGVLQRSLSQSVTVTIDPISLPPDPGPTGSSTLPGTDVDGDGIRDDVERYIAWSFPASPSSRLVLSQYAVALSPSFATGDADAAARAQMNAVACIASTFSDDIWRDISVALRARMLNTPERLRHYTNIRKSASVTVMPPIRISDLASHCL